MHRQWKQLKRLLTTHIYAHKRWKSQTALIQRGEAQKNQFDTGTHRQRQDKVSLKLKIPTWQKLWIGLHYIYIKTPVNRKQFGRQLHKSSKDSGFQFLCFFWFFFYLFWMDWKSTTVQDVYSKAEFNGITWQFAWSGQQRSSVFNWELKLF